MHADALLDAVTQLAREVQRATAPHDVFTLVDANLSKLGFDFGIVALEPTPTLRYVSPHLASRIRAAQAAPFKAPFGVDHRLVTHFTRDAGDWFALEGEAVPLKRQAMLVPLEVADNIWGVAFFMHDELDEPVHARPFTLLGLQVATAIDRSNHYELLDRRTSELDLVHQLAVTGPSADTGALCQRALDLICRSTHSDAGVLHRFDQASRHFEMIGECYGYQGPLADRFRRFAVPPENPIDRPRSVTADDLKEGKELAHAAGFAEFALLPMTLEGATVGTLTLARREKVTYTDDDLRAAEILGVQTSASLERVRLNDEANRLYRDLKNSYDELGRTQAELVRHERLAALGELAAVMAHEVRNPLGVIFNSLTTLKRLLRPTGDADMLLNIVGEEADRLNRIVGDLLDFVRPYELMKKPIAIEPVVASAVDAASQTLATSNVRVVSEFSDELPPFPADAHMLKQALVNLVVNAVQAMPRGGTVLVRVSMERRTDGAWLRINVCDEGVGLSPRAAEKMFQPFFTTKATGTGLGLAVVKRIVDGHQGEVIATANPAGRGTMFSVMLPPAHEREKELLTPPRGRAVP